MRGDVRRRRPRLGRTQVVMRPPPADPRRQLQLGDVMLPTRKGVVRWLELKAGDGRDVVISARLALWIADELKAAP